MRSDRMQIGRRLGFTPPTLYFVSRLASHSFFESDDPVLQFYAREESVQGYPLRHPNRESHRKFTIFTRHGEG